MASSIAGAATGGGGGNGNIGSLFRRKQEILQAQNAGQPGAAQLGGMGGAAMSVLGDPMSDGSIAGGSMADGAVGSIDAGGSTMGIEPRSGAGMPADPSGVDQFAGKKFEISPVQMKGSFSSKAREDAEGVYGSEEQRNNSLKR